MMIKEPILNDRDVKVWKIWEKAAFANSKTITFLNRVEESKMIIKKALSVSDYMIAVMWSGGKDSTCMTHLICVNMGIPLSVVSEKDDLDYDGEEEYIKYLAKLWNIDLDIVYPDVSLLKWVGDNCTVLDSLRGRNDELSRLFFYPLMEKINNKYGGAFVGLRYKESCYRLINFRCRGSFYRKKDGIYMCTPIIKWSGLDVMSYLLINDIEPLHIYRCVGFDPRHRNEPWRIRKSWWLPGEFTLNGSVAWLRRYYPSFFKKLCNLWPNASVFRG